MNYFTILETTFLNQNTNKLEIKKMFFHTGTVTTSYLEIHTHRTLRTESKLMTKEEAKKLIVNK